MLRREITRIELKPDDKEEFQRLREQRENGRLHPSSFTRVLSRQAHPKASLCQYAGLHQAFRTKQPTRKCILRAAATGSNNGDEVEIKLRLKDETAHQRVAEALRPHLITTHKQENIFYDGSEKELSKERVIIRTRFYNTDKRCLLTIKGQQVVKDGVGRGSEVEEDIDPKQARKFLQDPSALYTLESDILQPVLRNERSDYDWEGFKIELDKTMFPHGKVYEVEVETEDPDSLKPKLESFMKEHGVDYSYSTTTKFANFVNKTLE